MNFKSQKLSVAAIVFAMMITGKADAKPARCVITGEGHSYSGPCNFTVSKGGGFMIQAPSRKSLFLGSYSDMIVDVTSPGQADVVQLGLPYSGGGGGQAHALWGPSQRSTTEKACWVGEDYKICVY